MKKIFNLFLFLIFFISADAQHLTATHPEKGILPFNAPCTGCTEVLDKRTGNTREFFALNADGSKTIYIQKSFGNMNFLDKDGFWRTKDHRMQVERENVFAARMQPSPVVVDLENKYAAILNGGNEIRFNLNIALVHVDNAGAEHSLGTGDWNKVTRSEKYTETIFLVEDFYPGVDLQMVAGFGRVKTNFILKNDLRLNGGWLVIRQQIDLPAGMGADLSQSSNAEHGLRTGRIGIVDRAGREFFYFKNSLAFDAQLPAANYLEMPFKLEAGRLDYHVPVNWLNNSSTVYPVTLDPLVMASDSIPQAGITGSGFTPVCGTLGCEYFIDSLMTPPNCEITAINTYFSYLANLPCIRDDGGFDITMTNPQGISCTTRNFTCLGGIQGACFFWPAVLLNAVPPLAPCLLPPQCAPYPLDFKLSFRRCNWVPVVPCDATCILANSDWIMTIEGRTVEFTNSLPVHTICNGDCTTLTVATAGGLPPYSVQWSPGGMTGNSVTVCPTVTTHYTAVVTDLCGSTDTAIGGDVVVLNCTGIDEQHEIVTAIYPNPTGGLVTILFTESRAARSMVLTDMLGKTVFVKNDFVDAELTLDVSTLSKGIYFARVFQGNRLSIQKIIRY